MNNIIIENILSELDKGNFKDAIKSCNELLLKYPGNPELYKLRGICNYNLSNLEEASTDFKKVIELNPGAPDILRKKIDAIETVLKKKKTDESEIPDFDVTKVFQNVPFTEEDTFVKDPQEGFIEGKDIVSANLLRLHSEIEELKDEGFKTIEEIKDTEIKDTKIKNTGIIDNDRITIEEIKPIEEIKDTVIIPDPFSKDGFDSKIPAREIPVITEQEPNISDIDKVVYSIDDTDHSVQRSFFRSPLFFLSLVFAVLLIIIFLIYSLMKTDPMKKVQTELTDSLKNSVKKEVLKDSLKPSETDNQTTQKKDEAETKEAVKETDVKQEPVKDETKKETVKEEPKQEITLPHTIGFISPKQKFIMIQEKDGYWIQAGSYKEKSKAENTLNQIEKKGFKGEIIETNLGEKGIYYRVRLGSFGSQEEAKQKTAGLE